jgi:hypothetical protein
MTRSVQGLWDKHWGRQNDPQQIGTHTTLRPRNLFGSYWKPLFGPPSSIDHLLGKGISVQAFRSPMGTKRNNIKHVTLFMVSLFFFPFRVSHVSTDILPFPLPNVMCPPLPLVTPIGFLNSLLCRQIISINHTEWTNLVVSSWAKPI